MPPTGACKTPCAGAVGSANVACKTSWSSKAALARRLPPLTSNPPFPLPPTCTNLQSVEDYRRQMLPVPVRPVSAQEGADYLQHPSFSNCTVPFLFYATWRSNIFHVLGEFLHTCCGCLSGCRPWCSPQQQGGGQRCIQPTARRRLLLLEHTPGLLGSRAPASVPTCKSDCPSLLQGMARPGTPCCAGCPGGRASSQWW